jgi:hypothetical protein
LASEAIDGNEATASELASHRAQRKPEQIGGKTTGALPVLRPCGWAVLPASGPTVSARVGAIRGSHRSLLKCQVDQLLVHDSQSAGPVMYCPPTPRLSDFRR